MRRHRPVKQIWHHTGGACPQHQAVRHIQASSINHWGIGDITLQNPHVLFRAAKIITSTHLNQLAASSSAEGSHGSAGAPSSGHQGRRRFSAGPHTDKNNSLSTRSRTRAHTHGQYRVAISNSNACFSTVKGRTWREPTQTQGERGDSTQKGHRLRTEPTTFLLNSGKPII